MPNDLYAHAIRASLSQGDVIEDVVVYDSENTPTGDPKPKDRRFRVMVLSHSCDIDKSDSNACLCARVRPITDVREKFRDAIRTGKVAAIMYLPPGSALSEGYVEFRYSYRLCYWHIGATDWKEIDGEKHRVINGTDRRVISLSDKGQRTLQGALSVFYGADR